MLNVVYAYSVVVSSWLWLTKMRICTICCPLSLVYVKCRRAPSPAAPPVLFATSHPLPSRPPKRAPQPRLADPRHSALIDCQRLVVGSQRLLEAPEVNQHLAPDDQGIRVVRIEAAR